MNENDSGVVAGRKNFVEKIKREAAGVSGSEAAEPGPVSHPEINDAHYRSIQLPCDAFEEEVSDKPGN
ncbi:MAG: hypothetical protein ACI9JM_000466 [Halioglobus sp.]|jgi:hypothetical protein